MTRIAKAFFFGRKGRKALRSHVKRALDAHAKTGREHGFHAGKAGVDRTLQRGKTGSIRWSPRAAVGQMLRGGALHHTHPKGRGSLSPRDLRSVVTSQNSKGGRNTLWAHSPDGHEAARLTRRAAGQPVKQRRKMFADAYRATRAGSGGAYGHGQRLRRELKRRGLIHSGSTVRKMSELIETDEAGDVGKARLRGLRMSSAQRRLVAQGKQRKGDIGRTRNGRVFVRIGGAHSSSPASTREVPGMLFAARGRLKRAPASEQRAIARRLRGKKIRKSADPLAELDAAIEKAKGLIRGGSRKTLRRIADRAHKDPKNSRLARAYRYMAHRNPSERKGVYKSALSELDAAIEKASKHVYGMRMSSKQRRTSPLLRGFGTSSSGRNFEGSIRLGAAMRAKGAYSPKPGSKNSNLPGGKQLTRQIAVMRRFGGRRSKKAYSP